MKRIALLNPIGSPAARESMAKVAIVAARFGIDARTFRRSDDLAAFAPDCVLAWSCQDAKLTGVPTYGVLTAPVTEYVRTKRFMRNVLTYDACLTRSPEVSQWVRDIAFGIRKFSCPIAAFMPSIQSTAFAPTSHEPHPAYVGSIVKSTLLAPVLRDLASRDNLTLGGPEGVWRALGTAASVVPVPYDGESVLHVYREAGVGLDLSPDDGPVDGMPSMRLLEIVAASAVAITFRRAETERVFGDTVLYVDPGATPAQIAREIRAHLRDVRADRRASLTRAKAAHDIVTSRLAMDAWFPDLMDLHERVLVEKGYRPDPNPEYERNLPSATYIIRTGGGRSLTLLRRTLDSLMAQQYPKLKAMFVLFRPMPETDQLRAEYPALDIKVVDDVGGLRSTAICAGMRHVETDFFGLLDDDDVLNPNHVRMLIKALEYHNGQNWRGQVAMAYSASIEMGESKPRAEHAEYDDDLALVRSERRVMEHYRLYSSVEMSQHRWYLINSWLVRRDLIDDELLNDPHIHTCEDLYVALQIAQRTFLAFSGEVTMNHCYLDSSSTIVDSHRHLADTLRGALRHWTRLFPAEHGHGGSLMPLGRALSEPGHTERSEMNLMGHLAPRRGDARLGGAIVLGADSEATAEISSMPVPLSPAGYTISVQIDAGSGAGPGEGREAPLEVTVLGPGGTVPRVLATAAFEECDLGWQGDLLCADLAFDLTTARKAVPVRFQIRPRHGRIVAVKRLVLTRRPALGVSSQNVRP